MQYQGIPLEGKITFFTPDDVYLKTIHQIPGFIHIDKNSPYRIKDDVLFDLENEKTYQVGDFIPILIKDQKKKNKTLEFMIKSKEIKENAKKLVK